MGHMPNPNSFLFFSEHLPRTQGEPSVLESKTSPTLIKVTREHLEKGVESEQPQ